MFLYFSAWWFCLKLVMEHHKTLKITFQHLSKLSVSFVLQVLFLGPLMQLAMDCPWSFTDGVRVAFGKQQAVFVLLKNMIGKFSSIYTCCFWNILTVIYLQTLSCLLEKTSFFEPLLALCLPADPWFWMLCASDMRWLRNQVVAPLTEELVFRACMLPMLVPCAGPSIAIFTCPLFFGVGEFRFLANRSQNPFPSLKAQGSDPFTHWWKLSCAGNKLRRYTDTHPNLLSGTAAMCSSVQGHRMSTESY